MPKSAQALSDEELLARLRVLFAGDFQPVEQKSLLGIYDEPQLDLTSAFDRFWSHIKEEWMVLSADQIRTKRNVYLKSIRNFEKVVGRISLYEIDRAMALQFRAWWVERVANEGVKPNTGNREMNSLRRLFSTNCDIDSLTITNPFSRVRLKEEERMTRVRFEREQIEFILQHNQWEGLDQRFVLLFKLLVNTGMRPVEAIGLLPEDIVLDHKIPHVNIRKNSVRGLKTVHSERLMPLLGISLDAAQELIALGGWRNRIGKNMYATSMINKHLRAHGYFSDKKQSLYSLRHWFQDQLTRLDVVDRAQAQLMGHKFQRPKYGYGKDLTELRDIIAQFAI